MTTIARHGIHVRRDPTPTPPLLVITSRPAPPPPWTPTDPGVAYRVAMHALTIAHRAEERTRRVEARNDLLFVIAICEAIAIAVAMAAVLWL